MSKRFRRTIGFVWPVCLLLAAGLQANAAEVARTSSLKTYQDVDGKTYFALSVNPTIAAKATQARDILVLFDTSASQTGAYRDDALETLATLLKGLSQNERVNLMAIDLQAVPMSDGFVQPGSSELGSAVAELEARTPLGATDMPAGLRQAADAFSDSDRARSIVYIGDGISRANLPDADELQAAVDRLVENRISVSSFATGLRCNVELLAVLANHSGGSMFLDGPSVSPQMAGQGLLTIARGSVVWPSKVELPETATESYPTRFPPLRFDRDSVVLGTIGEAGDQHIRMLGELDGQTVEMSWTLKAEDTTNLGEDFAMLPELVKAARADHGLTSPILGTPGLVEARRIFAMTSETLSKLGNQALATGDAKSVSPAIRQSAATRPGKPRSQSRSQSHHAFRRD